ncbi:hypothetical protein M3Y99_01919300 [Aphelenchoides fujianensis]|nr:hypothetical protein M3Y99_01919300 [Aphelenchoides fujianensis]
MSSALNVFKAVPAFAIDVSDFAVINPTTILVLEPETLWLFRLDVESEKLETIELHRARPKSWPTYVFTEIRGTGVELRRTVLNQNYATELRFVRLDVDDAHFEVDAVERVEGARDYRLSSDGRWLRGLPFLSRELDTLDVFDLERRKWSTKKLSGEVGRLEDCSFSWTNDRVFLSGYDEVNDERRFSVFCLNLKESEWTKLPIVAANVRRISAIVDAESGEASAVDALRRHNLDVRGKEGFHKVMNGPCKSVFPSLYAGMTPILRL